MDALRYHLVILAAGEQLVSTGQASAPRQPASQHRTGRATAAASCAMTSAGGAGNCSPNCSAGWPSSALIFQPSPVAPGGRPWSAPAAGHSAAPDDPERSQG
jgi:hypothetical protein